MKQRLEGLTFRVRSRKGQNTFVGTTRIDCDQVGPPLVDSDWSALFATLYDGVEQEDLKSIFQENWRAHVSALDIEREERPG